MKIQEIMATFDDAMSDIRHGYWAFDHDDKKNRKILADGIVKMERIIDPLRTILLKHKEK